MNSQQSDKDLKVNRHKNLDVESLGFETLAIHHGQDPTRWDSRCVVPPLVMSTTFEQFAPGDFPGYEYGRSGNPSREVLEKALSSLEKAKHALAFSSGLGALTTLSYLLKCGDHIVCVVFILREI
jgi:cystathionine gamma-lyase